MEMPSFRREAIVERIVQAIEEEREKDRRKKTKEVGKVKIGSS